MLSAPVYIFRCFLHITYIWKLFSSLLWRYFYTTLGSTQFQIPFSKTHIFPPPCPPHRFLCSFVSLSTQHFTVQLLPPYGWASSYLTSPILVLSSSSLPYCGAINIFLHCKPSPYTLSDGGVFFLMACPLLDHTHSPWGVPSKKKKKQSECLFGVIFPVSVLHEDGLKSIAICFEQTRYAFIWIDAQFRR